jgi:hypothetical protein
VSEAKEILSVAKKIQVTVHAVPDALYEAMDTVRKQTGETISSQFVRYAVQAFGGSGYELVNPRGRPDRLKPPKQVVSEDEYAF